MKPTANRESATATGVSRDTEIEYQARQAESLAEHRTSSASFERYRLHRSWRFFPKENLFHRLEPIRNKKILDFGCGDGTTSLQLAYAGAEVTGVEISPDLIAIAEKRGDASPFKDKVRFIVGDIKDIHNIEGRFDAVLCSSVLHHVNLELILPGLLKALRPGGEFLMKEPIAFSQRLQQMRDWVPIRKDISPGEKQLSKKDIAFIRSNFASSDIDYFWLIGRFLRLFPNRNKIDRGNYITKVIVHAVMRIDKLIIMLFPFVRKYCGIVVIHGTR